MNALFRYRRLFLISALTSVLALSGCDQRLYCCEMENGCFDGPVDGEYQCRNLGGKPVNSASCQKGKCVKQ